ncbi:MAG: polyphosphate:AMP phosphotransferase [Betaproteobacteria bacterium RIFCSPLOWO2_12_FULL_63_13]|nr:MAG: polyphosphate:AMP phosphotransferase [Betaproteobacteria bacterium RIFCSPLOWO2_02_FULL_63_19]OGA45376.1 MAG: polyphosphate:AMP phosphotransferase [Betaproteobacteria bacterium RIFCSPLOWO2_12_FULL_63_13]
MFESADLDHKVSKEEYKREEPKLREALLNAQFDLGAQKDFAVLIIIGGVDGAGKGETVNLLNEWMDPRHIVTYAFGPPSDEEAARPPMWRFWRALPPRGKIGVFFGSWYTEPIVNRVLGKCTDNDLQKYLDEIFRHEKMLVDEGVLLLKFWFNLSKDQQRKRLKALESDPKTKWRVTKEDWRRFKVYDRFREISEHALRETSTAGAPWIVVPGADPRFRSLTAGRILLEALKKRLAEGERREKRADAVPPMPQLDNLRLLRSLDMTQRLEKKRYEKLLERYQGELNVYSRSKKVRKHSVILVFEGWDAGGKGSAVRRITSALDARQYRIVPIAAPTEEERAQPYLWRFWRHVPGLGGITIFDRSWYGRVLVERVEGFCSQADWMRAYSEINDFEEQLVQNGAVMFKYWLHITKDEQLRRFKERQKTSFKRFKITDEDWRNRDKWADYEAAVCDMVDRTSTEISPWTIVEAQDKPFARIKLLKSLVEKFRTL